MQIFFDIETIPGQAGWIKEALAAELEQAMADLRPPGNYKKEEAIAHWRKMESQKLIDQADDKYRRCALDAGRGEIISIAWAINDGPVKVISRAPYRDAMKESELLLAFFAELQGDDDPDFMAALQWVGHNIVEFDLPYLWRRCVVNNIRVSPFIPVKAKPWSDQVFDTMTEWAGHRNRISQDKLCQILGLPGKADDMDGSKVYDHWLNGDMDLIEAYNRNDVATVRAIYRRLTFGGV